LSQRVQPWSGSVTAECLRPRGTVPCRSSTKLNRSSCSRQDAWNRPRAPRSTVRPQSKPLSPAGDRRRALDPDPQGVNAPEVSALSFERRICTANIRIPGPDARGRSGVDTQRIDLGGSPRRKAQERHAPSPSRRIPTTCHHFECVVVTWLRRPRAPLRPAPAAARGLQPWERGLREPTRPGLTASRCRPASRSDVPRPRARRHGVPTRGGQTFNALRRSFEASPALGGAGPSQAERRAPEAGADSRATPKSRPAHRTDPQANLCGCGCHPPRSEETR
jgi:hypothetical protein